MSDWSSVAPWWLSVLGSSVLVALWHTSVVAVAFETWRIWQRPTPARRQYLAAAATLALATALTAATPVILVLGGRSTRVESPRTAARTAVVSPAAIADIAPLPRAGGSAWRGTARAVTTMATPWIGAAWCLGFAIGLLRLGAAWAIAQWIRRRAIALTAGPFAEAVRDAAATWSLPTAPVLASAHVEAPVVIGARAPAVLLPIDLEQRLDPAALRPLIAHELAHVDRQDYAANLLQSLADAALSFSPGARWLSRRVREAREYCCDDVVAARYGAGVYASALTTLAGLGVSARSRPAVNAVGPRLIVRIRRLLQEDTMIPYVAPKLIGAGLSLVLLAAAGGSLVSLSAAGIARGTRSPGALQEGPVPVSWIRSPSGAGVELRTVVSTEAGVCGTVTVENRNNVPVTALRFAGVPHYGRVHASEAADGSTVLTDFLNVAVAPGGTATIALNLLPPADLRPRFSAGRFQAMCAIQAVRFANGMAWSSPPAVIFARTYPEVSRAFLGRDTSGHPAFCRDEKGAEYSQGALIRIALEPGGRARCAAGVWIDHGNAAAPGGMPVVWLDFVLADGHRPAIGVQPGRMARLDVASGAWGLTPTIDPAESGRLRLEVFDLTVAPSVRVADLSLTIGDQPVPVPTLGATVQIRAPKQR
jgi:beta-lactamase regulating signal transducer with metallopeptidase domain